MKKYPLTAREWFWAKCPASKAEWNETGHDDEFMCRQMDEYGKYIITEYTTFLLKRGYCDSDVYDEPPSAIDRFYIPILDK